MPGYYTALSHYFFAQYSVRIFKTCNFASPPHDGFAFFGFLLLKQIEIAKKVLGFRFQVLDYAFAQKHFPQTKNPKPVTLIRKPKADEQAILITNTA